jgi:hypothetical protein
MSEQLMTQTKPKSMHAMLTPVSHSVLQRCSNGVECAECRKKREGTLQRAAVNSTSANDTPLIGHGTLSSLSRPSDTSISSSIKSRFEYDFSQIRTHNNIIDKPSHLSLQSRHLDLTKRTESVGEAACDADQGKVVFQLDDKSIPGCMLDCASAHEQAHVKFMQPACTRVSSAIRAAQEAIKKAEKSQTEANVKAAERAVAKAEEEGDVYSKWMVSNCKADELRAYQAGIDVCKTDKVKKDCADHRETEKYTNNMKYWEDIKNSPPNCAEPAKETGEKKPGELKKTETKKELEKPPKK